MNGAPGCVGGRPLARGGRTIPVNVRAEARTYLRSNGEDNGKGNSGFSVRLRSGEGQTKAAARTMAKAEADSLRG